MVKKRIHDLNIEEEEVIRPSKSEYKRKTEKVLKFVNELSKLSEKQLSKLGLPEEVIPILLESKKMKASGAKRRHLKNAISLLLDDEVWSHPLAIDQYERVAKGNKGLDKFSM